MAQRQTRSKATSATSSGQPINNTSRLRPPGFTVPEITVNQAPDTTKKNAASVKSGTSNNYSASDFAHFKDKLDSAKEKAGAGHWLYERNSLRVGCTSLPEPANDSEGQVQVNSMVDVYIFVTSLAWPEDWKNKKYESLAVFCDLIGQKTFSTLFDQYKAHESAAGTIPALAQDDFLCLKSRLSVFLYAVANARNRVVQMAEGVSLNEAEMREPFDTLINLFWSHHESHISDSYFKECQINLAKNQFQDGDFDHEALSKVWVDILDAQQRTIRAEEAESNKKKNSDIGVLAAERLKEVRQLEQKVVYTTPHAKLVLSSTALGSTKPKVVAFAEEFKGLNKSKDGENSQAEKTPKMAEPYQAVLDGLATIRVSVGEDYVAQVVSKSESKAPPNNPTPRRNPSKAPRTNTSESADIVRPSMFVYPKISSPQNVTDCPGIQNTSPKSTKSDSQHVDCQSCSFVTSHLNLERGKLENSAIPYSLKELALPSLFVEFKRRPYEDIDVAFYQCEMGMVSGLEFLATLGLYDFPVYGVVITGSRGVLMMAWKSTKFNVEVPSPEGATASTVTHVNIIMDQNLISFDLSEPLEAYRFAIMIHRIYSRSQKAFVELLKKKWQLGRILHEFSETDVSDRWIAKSQATIYEAPPSK